MTHREHAQAARVAVPCAAWHVNFGGGCLNCGWLPQPDDAPEGATLADSLNLSPTGRDE